MLLTGTATLASMGVLGLVYIYAPYKMTKMFVNDFKNPPVKIYKVNEFMNK